MPSTHDSTNSLPVSQPPRRLSWSQAAAISLSALIAGLLFTLWHPLWLAPPYLQATLFLYVACGLVWLPILLVCALLRPTGKRSSPAVLFLVGLIASCLVFSFSGPLVPVGAFGSPLDCQVASHTADRVRYECVANRMFVVDTYRFEGAPGWLIVWLVSKTTVSS